MQSSFYGSSWMLGRPCMLMIATMPSACICCSRVHYCIKATLCLGKVAMTVCNTSLYFNSISCYLSLCLFHGNWQIVFFAIFFQMGVFQLAAFLTMSCYNLQPRTKRGRLTGNATTRQKVHASTCGFVNAAHCSSAGQSPTCSIPDNELL